MNKIRTLLVLCAMCIATISAAQSKSGKSNSVEHGPYEYNSFLDNLFFSARGGFNIYHGTDDSEAAFGDRAGMSLNFELGKWFTPVNGVRFQISLNNKKGITFQSGPNPPMSYGAYGEHIDNSYYKEKWSITNFHLDYLFDFTNLFFGYDKSRIWNSSAFLGCGMVLGMYEGGSISTNEYQLSYGPIFGLISSIKIFKDLSASLEINHLVVDCNFDGQGDGSKYESMSTFSVGLTYNLGFLGRTDFTSHKGGKSYKKPRKSNNTANNSKITDLEKAKKVLKQRNDALRRQNADLIKAQKQLSRDNTNMKNQMKEYLEIHEATPVVLFFPMSRATLDMKELTNLDFYVRHAIALDKNKVFTIIGSADKATGRKDYNKKLSEKRVEYIKNILVKKYKIPANRFVFKAVGDTDNRFPKPLLNRAVIIE